MTEKLNIAMYGTPDDVAFLLNQDPDCEKAVLICALINAMNRISSLEYDISNLQNEMKKAVCPQCGGLGKYQTDNMAKYGDEPVVCPHCKGSGKNPIQK